MVATITAGTTGRLSREERPIRSPQRWLDMLESSARYVMSKAHTDTPLDVRRTIAGMAKIQPPVFGAKHRWGTVAGVRGMWVEPKVRKAGVLLYLHGGGYIAGSPKTHAQLVTALAKRTRRAAFIPDYRLAPEHPADAALDDASAVADSLVARFGADRVIVGGDSAGGGLSAALLMRRRDEGKAPLAGAVLLSPWVDLRGPTQETIAERAHLDVVMQPEQIAMAAAAYAGSDLANPYVSPLLGDGTGLPDTLIQVGTHELLGAEGERLAQLLASESVTVRLQVWDQMPHVFQTVPLFRERSAALDEIATFIDQRLSAAA